MRKYASMTAIASIMATTFSLAGCTDPNARTAAEHPATDTSAASGQPNTPVGQSMSLSQQLEFSTEDLAQRLGVDTETITVIAVRKVNWRSGALGCPDQGMSYTDALVPGVLILLESNGVSYGYHAKTDGQPFHCPQDRVEQPASIQTEDLA